MAKNTDPALIKHDTKQSYALCRHGDLCTRSGRQLAHLLSLGPAAGATVTLGRVRRTWQGHKRRKRKNSYDAIRERDILDAIDTCEYVCSVSTAGLAEEAGREKALTAARLALAAIALLWQMPSETLHRFHLSFDRNIHRQKTLTFVPGTIILAESKCLQMPHGPTLQPGKWEKVYSAGSTYFAVVGEILEYFLSPTGKVRRPNMMNALAQSLLWFHEGCRESVMLMGIVKFSASMDALAVGTEDRGIRRVINARLKIKDETPIRPAGPTMKQVIDQIYKPGRSRTIHGTTDKLGHDWTVTRGLAEQWARLCLVSCIEWVGNNSLSDDPAQLAQ